MQAARPESLTQLARRAPDLSLHFVLLALASAIVFLSFVLTIEGGRQVVIPILEVPLPGICTYQRWFGIECPGCGLTRSFISVAHGDMWAAWSYNPAGLLGFLFVAAQLPYRTTQVIRLRRGQSELALSWLGQIVFGTFFVVLVIQWLIRTFVL